MLTHCCEKCKLAGHFVVSSKIGKMPTFTPAIPFLGAYPRETLARVHMKTHTALFVSEIEPSKCLSVGEWINCRTAIQ